MRPQLIDRSGLCVLIEGEANSETRVEIIKRREFFDQTPPVFWKNGLWRKEKCAWRSWLPATGLAKVALAPETE